MRNSTVLKIVLTASLVVAGGGFLVYASLDDAQYYEFVDVVAKQPEKWEGRDLKLHGYVVPGTIKDEGGGTHWSFVLERNGEKVAIDFQGVKPDNLKDRSEVVAQGKLHTFADGKLVLRSNEIMAKCPSKYKGAQSNQELF
jgi:cytochrome c-type biogenesis protein CcmE